MGIFKKGRLTVADDTVTNAAQLTLRQSLLPNILGRFSTSPEYFS
jgi:hypothetical protein